MKFILLFYIFLTFCVLSFGQDTQQSEDVAVIERKVDHFFDGDFNKFLRLDSFFRDIFQSTCTSAGVVFANNEDIYKEKFELQPESLMLKDILDSFVKVKPEYLWNETNNVINIFPKDDYLILDTRIAEFKVEKISPDELYKIIVQTPEFQSYIKEKNLVDRIPGNKYGFIISGPRGRTNYRNHVSIDLKNTTIREILNEAVRQRDCATWIYREYKVEDEGINYNFYRFGQ